MFAVLGRTLDAPSVISIPRSAARLRIAPVRPSGSRRPDTSDWGYAPVRESTIPTITKSVLKCAMMGTVKPPERLRKTPRRRP